MQPTNNKLTRDLQYAVLWVLWWWSKKICSKKAKYCAGVAVTNRIAVRHQANRSHSEIYSTLKAEEIPISLPTIKRIGQRFETGNVVSKKGSSKNVQFSKTGKEAYKNCQHKTRLTRQIKNNNNQKLI